MKRMLYGILSIIISAAMAGCGNTTINAADNTFSDNSISENADGSLSENADMILQPEPAKIKENAKVSYLGPAGTYTEEASKLFFDENAVFLPQGTVDDAIAEMISENTDYAVIPQENTLGGAVTNYVDALLAQENVYVVGEVILPISQTLMGIPGTTLEDIKTVCSHAQGIKQTEEWRKENLPDAVTEEKDSTAAAASYTAKMQDKSIAAIAAPGAAELYGLEIIAENVQISMENKTRFYVLANEKNAGSHTNAVFAASCGADKIDDIMFEIHNSGLETVTIHDRPEGSALGIYNYIIETENAGGVTEEQINAVCKITEVRFLGCFDVTQK